MNESTYPEGYPHHIHTTYPEEFIGSFATKIQERMEVEESAPEASDLNIIYYVAGALVRSELKLRKSCSSCKDLLLEPEGSGEGSVPFLTLEGVVTENVKQFYEEITRGGLLAPSTAIFGACVKAWSVYQNMMGSADTKQQFLKSDRHQELFVRTVMYLLNEDSDLEEISVSRFSCERSHQSVKSVMKRFFNVMIKNLVRSLSSIQEKADISRRKSAKLSSRTSAK